MSRVRLAGGLLLLAVTLSAWPALHEIGGTTAVLTDLAVARGTVVAASAPALTPVPEPQGVTCTFQQGSGLLEWDAVEGASGYRVYHSPPGSGDYELYTEVFAPDTTAPVDEQLGHLFVVATFTDGAESEPSEAVSCTPRQGALESDAVGGLDDLEAGEVSPSATSPVAGEAVETPTPEPTAAAASTETPTAQPASEDVPEPTAEPAPDPEPGPADEGLPDATSTPEATPEATPEPTPLPTAGPTAEPTAEPTEEPVAVAIEGGATDPAVEATSTAEPAGGDTAYPEVE